MRVKRETNQYWLDLLEEIDEEGLGLSSWEIDFVESLLRRIGEQPSIQLTPAQKDKIEDIHEKRVA